MGLGITTATGDAARSDDAMFALSPMDTRIDARRYTLGRESKPRRWKRKRNDRWCSSRGSEYIVLCFVVTDARVFSQKRFLVSANQNPVNPPRDFAATAE